MVFGGVVGGVALRLHGQRRRRGCLAAGSRREGANAGRAAVRVGLVPPVPAPGVLVRGARVLVVLVLALLLEVVVAG